MIACPTMRRAPSVLFALACSSSVACPEPSATTAASPPGNDSPLTAARFADVIARRPAHTDVTLTPDVSSPGGSFRFLRTLCECAARGDVGWVTAHTASPARRDIAAGGDDGGGDFAADHRPEEWLRELAGRRERSPCAALGRDDHAIEDFHLEPSSTRGVLRSAHVRYAFVIDTRAAEPKLTDLRPVLPQPASSEPSSSEAASDAGARPP